MKKVMIVLGGVSPTLGLVATAARQMGLSVAMGQRMGAVQHGVAGAIFSVDEALLDDGTEPVWGAYDHVLFAGCTSEKLEAAVDAAGSEYSLLTVCPPRLQAGFPSTMLGRVIRLLAKLGALPAKAGVTATVPVSLELGEMRGTLQACGVCVGTDPVRVQRLPTAWVVPAIHLEAAAPKSGVVALDAGLTRAFDTRKVG